MSAPAITSVHNPRLKAALKLRDRKHRQAEGRFLIDGRREIERAIAGGIEIETVFVKFPSRWLSSPRGEGSGAEKGLSLLAELAKRKVPLFETAELPFQRLAFGERDEGIVAVAKTPQTALESIKLPDSPLIAVLEGIEKPGNVGAVLRTADAAGVSAVIVAEGGTDLFNPNTIRASLGAIFTVPVCSASSDEALAWLREKEIAVFAARVEGAVDYASASYTGPSAIVLGSEAQGLSDVWRGPDVTTIALPMRGVGDSLNVSAAAAVLFYEAVRQRRQAAGIKGRR